MVQVTIIPVLNKMMPLEAIACGGLHRRIVADLMKWIVEIIDDVAQTMIRVPIITMVVATDIPVILPTDEDGVVMMTELVNVQVTIGLLVVLVAGMQIRVLENLTLDNVWGLTAQDVLELQCAEVSQLLQTADLSRDVIGYLVSLCNSPSILGLLFIGRIS